MFTCIESPDVSRRESYLCAVDDVSPKLDRKKSIEVLNVICVC